MTDPVIIAHPLPHVALITLNRPHVANAVDRHLTAALEQAVIDAERDQEVRVAILAGAGRKAFCAGADLKEIAAGAREELYTARGGFAGFVDAPREKCWIAAVEYPALAGGLEIALACDFIITGAEATFALPEVKRGLVAAAGGLFRLPLRMSSGLALEMIATGDTIDAATAARSGLADHLVPAGQVIGAALRLAGRIAAAAPIAVRESLKVARAARNANAALLREMSHQAAQRNASTEDFAEGPRAFLEKRAPVWNGR